MLHLLPKFHSLTDSPAPDAEPVPPAASHHHLPAAAFMTAIGHLHLSLPEPRPSYPLHEPGYLETELMSRLMEHL